MLGRSSIELRQHPDMAIAIDMAVKQQLNEVVANRHWL